MFYVGQKVVAIRDHSIGKYKKGDEFIVLNVKDCNCKCNYALIDIGFSAISIIDECNLCGLRKVNKDNIWWFGSKNFAPLESYRESYSIAIQLVQEMEQVDKQKVFNPKKETV